MQNIIAVCVARLTQSWHRATFLATSKENYSTLRNYQPRSQARIFSCAPNFAHLLLYDRSIAKAASSDASSVPSSFCLLCSDFLALLHQWEKWLYALLLSASLLLPPFPSSLLMVVLIDARYDFTSYALRHNIHCTQENIKPERSS